MEPLTLDKRIKLRSNILTSFVLLEPPELCHTRLTTAYGTGTLSMDTVRFWYDRFSQHNFDIADKPREGRPKIPGLAPILRPLIEENPQISAKRLAIVTGHARETIRKTVCDELGLRRVSHKYVPHLLSQDQKNSRKSIAVKILPILLDSKEYGFSNVYTGDESWMYYDYPVGDVWVKEGEPRPLEERKMVSSKKMMITTFWNGDGNFFLEALEEGQHINAAYFVSSILKPLESHFGGDSILTPHPQYIHFDNARPHTAKITTSFLKDTSFTVLPHPAYSPDLAPCDFWMFGYMKGKLAGKRFETGPALQAAILAFLKGIDKSMFVSTMKEWIERLRFVIKNGGDYFLN
jgi:histone-lysine N-methyltransferase SETMAR